MPAPSFLIMPARVIRRWLTTSASAGASFRVETKKREAFIDAGSKKCGETTTPQGRGDRTGLLAECNPACIIDSVQKLGFDYARPRWLQAQRRHHPAQPSQSGFLGQAHTHPLMAVSARRHRPWRKSRASHVPGAA